MSDSSERKTHQASAQKLRKQREKGTVPQVPDAVNYIAQAFVLALMLLGAPYLYGYLMAAFDGIFELATRADEAVLPEAFGVATWLLGALALPFVITTLVATILATLIVQKGFVFSVDPLVPKPERLSISAAFKRIYGQRGWVQLGAGICKLLIWGAISWGCYLFFKDTLFSAILCGWQCLPDVFLSVFLPLLLLALLVFVVIAVFEVMLQKWLFGEDQKMTESEVKKERKDQHGSPEIRQARRAFQRDLEQSPGRSEAPKKSTMVVYWGDMAVGLFYDFEDQAAPIITDRAFGMDKAMPLRKDAKSRGAPEGETELLVSRLVRMPVGSVVPPDMFPALIEVMKKMYGAA